MTRNNKILKLACYSANVSMSVIGNLSPLLFLTFKELYGISYSLLGLLVLINFCTQLAVDLLFSFFSHKINIRLAVRLMPVIAAIGLIILASAPLMFPGAEYVGIAIGTVIASAGSGLAEVLVSPIIAAIPAENPDKEMSKLHSVYAWGVVFVAIFSTLFLLIFGNSSWNYLALILTLIPIISAILYFSTDIPECIANEGSSGSDGHKLSPTLLLMVLAIFLGGASECTMAQWCSGYLEKAVGVDKVWGDIFGVALFAVMLGVGRSLYASRGKRIERVLFLGSLGAAVMYLTAALVGIPIVGLIACALTGLCVSMLWPGSLIVAQKKIPGGGVFMFAIMAAGGDLGASVAPQLLGIITDKVSASSYFIELASNMGISPEQMGMKTGMLIASLFPIAATVIFLCILMKKPKAKNE